MAKHLVIVESPAKAKTIEKFLGKDYSVKSSFGHIRDLPKKGISIDIAHDFEPTYQISPDKTKVVNELKKAAKAADAVWLASDEDREGEAIAWHLCEALKLNVKNTKRIVFHEITKSAIEHAVANPRTVDTKLVDAQQARRVLDRIVGYELSPVLWKKVRPGLSAGRVQSVAVRLIVEREREIKAFEADSFYKVRATFKSSKGSDFPADLIDKLKDSKEATKLLENSKGATFTIDSIDQKPGKRNPGPPFTTSSLQQEAARRLGYSVKQTMTLAQRLYESGHITYMRTDSTVLSQTAIVAAKDYIVKTFGDQYHDSKQFKTKDANAQLAHEAIRPTHFEKLDCGSDAQQKKLYKLIWQRALSSQMSPANTDRTEVVISCSKDPRKYLAKGEVLKFDGFLKVYGGGKDDVILPELAQGQKLDLEQIEASQTYSKPPARYSEASLVKKLEELGIGRPSTYAPTISTIQTRGYVEKGDLEGQTRPVERLVLAKGKISQSTIEENYGADRSKLLPTPIADVTTDFLVKHFASIVDFDFTAKAEEEFDDIADGKLKWVQMMKDFYKHFHPLVEKSDDISREDSMQSRKIGVDPKTKQPIVVRYGRFGPMIQRGETESDDKPDFAPLPDGVSMDDVTLAQALEMLKLPRVVGKTKEGEEIVANIGRFGPYIKIDPIKPILPEAATVPDDKAKKKPTKPKSIYVSIKPLDPFRITEAEALKLYAAKLKKEKERHIQVFESGIQILNGQYGPYITDGKKNAKIPKDTDPKTITEAKAKKLLEEAPAKRSFRRRPAKAK